MAFLRVAIAVVIVLVLSPSFPTAAPEYLDWSVPVNLGPLVNSTVQDIGPALSKDGLSLYFGSNRPGGFGGLDIWISRRASVDAPWGTPENLGPTVNSSATENVPTFSRDGHWMFFNSNAP